MTKLVIFDLDGVLIDSKDYHYDALMKHSEKSMLSVEKNMLVHMMVFLLQQS